MSERYKRRSDDEYVREFNRMSDDDKIYHATKILSAAPSDPREWPDNIVGISFLLGELTLARGDYVIASREWDRVLTYIISQCGIEDDGDVVSAAYNAGSVHWFLEDSLGVLSVTEPVYNYWTKERIPTPRCQSTLSRMVRLYAASGRPREASRLNRRVIQGAIRYRRPYRFIRSVMVQAVIGLGLYGLAGRPDLEGRMRRPKRYQ